MEIVKSHNRINFGEIQVCNLLSLSHERRRVGFCVFTSGRIVVADPTIHDEKPDRILRIVPKHLIGGPQ